MGKIIKKNGKIWLEEIQDALGKHKKLIYLGEYNEIEKEKPKMKRKKSN
jgi:hypothetical protein